MRESKTLRGKQGARHFCPDKGQMCMDFDSLTGEVKQKSKTRTHPSGENTKAFVYTKLSFPRVTP